MFYVVFQICKDKVEAEVWITGLKALISSGQGGRSKIDGWSDGGLYLDVKIPTCCLLIAILLVSCFLYYGILIRIIDH